MTRSTRTGGLPDSRLGCLRWGSRRGGALTPMESATVARELVSAQLTGLPQTLRRRLGAGRAKEAAVLSVGTPPDSAITRRARDVAAECSAQPLLLHSLRCWYWADLFAKLDDVEHDTELLYLACILHDIGLSERYRPALADDCRCFAIGGARQARQLLLNEGIEAGVATRVADAIALHFNPSVAVALGAEAHLLHAAAQLDVAGVRAHDLPRRTRDEVVALLPRDRFVAAFGRAMQREAIERPRS